MKEPCVFEVWVMALCPHETDALLLCVCDFTALKSPAAFHEQIRSLERARVRAGHQAPDLLHFPQPSGLSDPP